MEWICQVCKESFVSRRKLQKHRKETKHNIKGKQPKIQCFCVFCNREFNRFSSKALHEKYCQLNPNKIKCKGHKNSEETRKKISEGMKKAHKEGRANEWHGRKVRSYAEQSWYNIFANDLGLETFINNYFIKKYWLDFAWPNKKIYFEVDGRTHFTEEGIKHDIERTEFLNEEGWKLIGRCNWSEYQKLSKEEKKKYIKHIESLILNEPSNINNYNINLLLKRKEEINKKEKKKETKKQEKEKKKEEELAKKEKKKKEELAKKEKLIEERRKILNEIDMNSFGWVMEVAKKWGISWTQTKRWIKKYYPDLKYYQRNSIDKKQ